MKRQSRPWTERPLPLWLVLLVLTVTMILAAILGVHVLGC